MAIDLLEERLHFYRPLIEKRLEDLLPEQPGMPQNELFKAARYSAIEGGGKRLRPLMTLLTTEAFKGSYEKALTPACALEMIHVFSLIHDDLPGMDNDDFRRGKPTLHKLYKEGHAILTGDYLLNYAYEIIVNDGLLSTDQKLAIMKALTSYTGAEGMIGGQVIDLASEGQMIPYPLLMQMDLMKTAALFVAALEIGAVISGLTQKEISLLKEFGQAIGLAFQIVDDVLDATDPKFEESSDNVKAKATYVSLLGLEEAKMYAEGLLSEAEKVLEKLSHDTAILNLLARKLIHRSV
ncbi:MAG: crtE [Chlamydiales bacterium]|jgi:geranylgeranyl diphosphate synthase type II|nr:crtE [Chlamydiales bacterium]